MTFALTFIDMALYSSGMEARDMVGYLVEMVDPVDGRGFGDRAIVSHVNTYSNAEVWWLTGKNPFKPSRGGYLPRRFRKCSAAPLITSEQARGLSTTTDDFHGRMVIAALGGLEKLKTMEVE